MFEKTLEEMIAHPYFSQDDVNLADRQGVTLHRGGSYTFQEGLELIDRCDRAIKGGIIYKKNEKKFRRIRNTVVYSFGPDMEEYLRNRQSA